MAISKEVIEKTANLAHLELTPQEIELYNNQLDSVLGYIDQLKEVDTQGVKPMVCPTEMLVTTREDVVDQRDDSSWVTENAPENAGNLFKVPPVL